MQPGKKLPDLVVLDIRRLIARRDVLKAELQLLTNDALGEHYNVKAEVISNIATGKTYKHLLRG